jgi:hypothetical protein
MAFVLHGVHLNDLRNGAAGTIQPQALGDAVHAKWFWTPITVQAAAAPTPAEFTAHRAALLAGAGYLAEHYFMQLDAGVAAVRAVAYRRRHAIVLGAVRAAAEAFWGLTIADLNATEVAQALPMRAIPAAGQTPRHLVPPPVTYRTTRAGTIAAAENALVGAPAVLPANLPPGVLLADLAPVAMPGAAPADAWTALTNVERSVIQALVEAGQVLLPLAGVSFCEGKHIYTKQVARNYSGVFKQVGLLGSRATPDVKAWLEAFTGEGEDDWRSTAVHKALHPISRTLMRALATNVEVGVRVRGLQLGAALIRLPYRPGIVKRAQTWSTVAAGAQAEIPRASPAMNYVEAGVQGVMTFGNWANLAGMSVASDPIRTTYAAENAAAGAAVTVARKMLLAELALEAELKAVAPAVAYCAGYMMASFRDAGVRTTLTQAYSITSLKNEYPMQYSAGAQFYEKKGRWDREHQDRAAPMPTAATATNPAIVA